MMNVECQVTRLSRWQRRERAAADALRTFLRDLHEARFGAVAPHTPSVDLQFRLRLQPGEDWALVFDPPLGEQAEAQLARAHARLGVYSEGRVFCFRCDSTACAHAAPPDSLAVFAGYDPVGLPEWKELTQVLLESKDERVGLLHAPRAPLVARVQLGRELRERQLGLFGRSSQSYSILGQVVAGYLGVPAASSPEGSARMAFTFQVVEGRSPDGAPSLRLNTLVHPPPGVDWPDARVGEELAWLDRAVASARDEVDRLERRLREGAGGGGGEARRALAGVPGMLRRLADSLQRGHRQGGRRTRHVERRRHEQRPLHKALDDLAAASASGFFRDEREGTAVVLGEQGRAHVFSPEGRHVTSFVLPPGGAEARVRTRRWAAASPADLDALRAAVRGKREEG